LPPANGHKVFVCLFEWLSASKNVEYGSERAGKQGEDDEGQLENRMRWREVVENLLLNSWMPYNEVVAGPDDEVILSRVL